MKFDINFVEKSFFSFSHFTKLGLLIFFISLLSIIFFIGSYQTKLKQQLTQALPAENFPKKLQTNSSPKIHYSDEYLEVMSKISMELSIPWDALLNGLEQIDINDITLLSLTPNFKSKSVILSGQSKSMESVLDYMKQLENLPMLSEVYLQKHTIEPEKLAQPLSFTIVAKWSS